MITRYKDSFIWYFTPLALVASIFAWNAQLGRHSFEDTRLTNRVIQSDSNSLEQPLVEFKSELFPGYLILYVGMDNESKITSLKFAVSDTKKITYSLDQLAAGVSVNLRSKMT